MSSPVHNPDNLRSLEDFNNLANQPKDQDFPDAIREVLNGKMITRRSWPTNDNGQPETFVKLHEGWLKIFTKNPIPPSDSAGQPKAPGFHDLIVSEVDMKATDWVVV